MAARVTISFAVLLVVVMPWTEYFWSFDKFLRGGQDLELTLLGIATVVCLVLFLTQKARSIIALALSSLKSIRRVQQVHPAIPESFSGLIANIHAGQSPTPALCLYNFPIQI
jgi:hypothetical protein